MLCKTCQHYVVGDHRDPNCPRCGTAYSEPMKRETQPRILPTREMKPRTVSTYRQF